MKLVGVINARWWYTEDTGKNFYSNRLNTSSGCRWQDFSSVGRGQLTSEFVSHYPNLFKLGINYLCSR